MLHNDSAVEIYLLFAEVALLIKQIDIWPM